MKIRMGARVALHACDSIQEALEARKRGVQVEMLKYHSVARRQMLQKGEHVTRSAYKLPDTDSINSQFLLSRRGLK